MIEVNNLHRTYLNKSQIGLIKQQPIKALRGLNFTVSEGEIFGLLGPNGAGKTTTLKILSTMLNPTSGEALIFGENTASSEARIRPYINFVFGGERGFYWRLSTIEILTFFSDLYQIPRNIQLKRIPRLLDLVGLSKREANQKVETYSKGMKQKTQIARGLVNDPKVLFLDEPTLGLDPEAAIKFRKIVKSLAAENKTIILTTHYMAEAEELCDRIAIINKGTLVACDATENIIKRFSPNKSRLEAKVKHFPESKEILFQESIDKNNIHFDRSEIGVVKIILELIDSNASNSSVNFILNNFELLDLHIKKTTLEQAYLEALKSK